jgi:glycerophosphoryl diester phosphodiesterase
VDEPAPLLHLRMKVGIIFMNRTMIVAHSGCDNTVQDSMEGIIAALNQNVDYIEVDLRLYEGNVYLSHNPFDGNQLNRYVTFQNVLKLLAPEKVKLNCDLKERSVFNYALKNLREYGMEERVVFTGDYENSIDANAKYSYFLNVDKKDLHLYNNIIEEQDADKIINFYKNSKDKAMTALNIDYRIISPAAKAKFYASGIRISYWTVDDSNDIDHLLQNNVFSITTNNIAYAVLARARILGA